ncbi:MAG: hypothetical protein ABW078_05675 [Sedimenticola sp.]
MIRKTRNTLIIAICILLAVEIGLQVRSQIRYGQSVFNAISAETTYIHDPVTGLKLLRPNHRIEGSQATIVTNALGLRDEPLPEIKPEDEFRIAIVGASTVMGTYTRNNQDTLSYRLQAILNKQTAKPRTRVINAGIAGYSLNEQRRIIEQILALHSVDQYVLYPGFNDLGVYCRNNTDSVGKESYALPALELPSWLLTTELISKNTVNLRSSVAQNSSLVDPNTLDTKVFEDDMAGLAATLKATGRPVLVVGNSWAFRRGMSNDQRIKLSESARYYKSCFDTDGLETLFENHNRIIERMAVSHGLGYFDLQEKLPGGSRYFGDSSHFSIYGTRRVAEIVADQITGNKPLPMVQE